MTQPPPPVIRHAAHTTDTSHETFRVATFNIATSDLTPERMNLVAKDLNSADVVLLQETCPMNGTHTADYLADRLNLTWATADLLPTTEQQCAILTHPAFPVINNGVVTLTGERQDAVYADIAIADNIVRVYSAHLPWGGDYVGGRLTALTTIVEHVNVSLASDNPPAGVVLGMDANSLDDSDEIRWLTGKAYIPSLPATYWNDVVDVLGASAPTSVLAGNPLSAAPARAVGISDPDLLPSRRIDYIMIHGWPWGKILSPLRAQTGTDTDTFSSDHLPVFADLWTGHTHDNQ
jgi:endonuclease/exonuclease/phosphatase family metal-dependent hydrolase